MGMVEKGTFVEVLLLATCRDWHGDTPLKDRRPSQRVGKREMPIHGNRTKRYGGILNFGMNGGIASKLVV